MLKWLLREAWNDLNNRNGFRTYKFFMAYAIILGSSTAFALILLVKSQFINTKVAALTGFIIGLFLGAFIDIVEWLLKKLEEAGREG